MRKHDQILNNDQMSNPSSVISIYTIILLWKISVMLMIFVIWDIPVMSILFLVIELPLLKWQFYEMNRLQWQTCELPLLLC